MSTKDRDMYIMDINIKAGIAFALLSIALLLALLVLFK